MESTNEFKAFTKEEVMQLLGVGKTTYHKLCKYGVLKSSRLYPGGPRRHTREQLDEYSRYLNSDGQVRVASKESEFEARRRRRIGAR